MPKKLGQQRGNILDDNLDAEIIKQKKLINKKPTKQLKRNYCGVFKTDINGRKTPVLHKSCIINQTCRKTKCSDIDTKIHNARFKIWGFDYNKQFSDISRQCSKSSRTPKSYKLCQRNAIAKIHKDAGLEQLYNQLQECDKQTCSRERRIFITNLMRHRKISKKQINLRNEPDMNTIKEPVIFK